MAFTLVASVSVKGAGPSSSIDTTGANFLVAGVSGLDFGSPDSVPTDSKSNTWIPLTVITTAGTNMGRIFYVENPTVGSGHTFGTTGGFGFASIGVEAWSGAATSSSFDDENGAGNAFQSGAVSPDSNDELVFASISYQSDTNYAETPTIDGGFTIQEFENYTLGGDIGIGIAHLVQTTAASANPTWDLVQGDVTLPIATIATFRAAGGGGGATWPGYIAPQGWF